MSKLGALLIASLIGVAAGNAHAALIGVTQNYPDVTLSANTLIYDATGVDANTGLLRVVSGASSLNRAPGQATSAQSYFGVGDSVPNLMLSFAISNTTGALVSNATFNRVSIGFGNLALANSSNFGFSWQGTISQFGFNATGSAFDAAWTMTSDQYQSMPSGFESFVNGALTGDSLGGLKITSVPVVLPSGSGNMWAFDWIRGQFAGTENAAFAAQIQPYVSGIATSANRESGSPTVDVFVPLPAAAWMLLGGLGALLGFARRSPSARSPGQWAGT